jgi:aminotransferase
MDTSDPDITFNEAGVCNHCIEYGIKERQRKWEQGNLPNIVAQIKKDGEGRDYDCLLGVSGGVDSATCLDYLLALGLRPLCFSVDNGWNTKEADENIMRLVEGGRVPFYRYTIDLKTFRDLQRAFIASGTPNIEIPTDHILMAASYEVASKYNIKWIISGGNQATESIMPSAWGYNARDLRFVKSIYRRYTGKRLSDLPTLSLCGYLYARFFKKIRILNLLDYYEYNRAEAIQLLSEKYGYKPYGEKHGESVFTKWFQNVYLYNSFEYDKRRAHLSSEINSGQLSRSDALEALKVPPSDCTAPFEDLCCTADRQFVQQKHTHRDFKNSEKYWNALSWIYQQLKKIS